MKSSKRFINEYANYKIREIENNSLMQPEHKAEKVRQISKAINLELKKFISINEAMKIINEA